MDFDHLGAKTKSVAMMVAQSYKLELILEEIKKCEVVCACCHRIRTERRKQNFAPSFSHPIVRISTQELVEDIFDLFGAEPAVVLSVADIAKRIEAKYGAVAKRLRTLLTEGRLASPRRGLYCLPNVAALRLAEVLVCDAPSLQDRALASLPLRSRIIAWFVLNPTRSFSAAELGKRLSFGDAPNSINVRLSSLAREGRLSRLEHGQYRLPTNDERYAPLGRAVTPSLKRERARFERLQTSRREERREMAVA